MTNFREVVRVDDRLQCDICKKWFSSLVTHVTRAHKISTLDYKLEYNYNPFEGLISENQKEKVRKARKNNYKPKE